MSPSILFWTPTLIWASTWHVVLYQLGTVPPVNSVGYRFVLAAALLAVVAWRLGSRAPRGAAMHLALACTGALQYGLNYLGVYLAEQWIASGLVAVLFSLMVFGNALVGAWWFGRPITRPFVVGGAAGVAGVALIFWPELAAAGDRPDTMLGLGIGLAAVAAATVGNALTLKLAERLQPQGVVLPAVLATTMAYGGAGLLVASGLTTGWHFDPRAPYVASLLYLTVFGTVIAFLAYFRYAQRFGPGRAALSGIAIPVIALAVSAALEGWRPGPASLAGLALCLGGLWWALRPR